MANRLRDGKWFAGRMRNEHPELNDFGNWSAPLALAGWFWTDAWGVAPGWYEPGLWPAPLRHEGLTTPLRAENVRSPTRTVPPSRRAIAPLRRDGGPVRSNTAGMKAPECSKPPRLSDVLRAGTARAPVAMHRCADPRLRRQLNGFLCLKGVTCGRGLQSLHFTSTTLPLRSTVISLAWEGTAEEVVRPPGQRIWMWVGDSGIPST